jgi:macrolide transport system ATP-binding/permease protein
VTLLRTFRIIRRRLESLWQKSKVDRQLANELTFHLEKLVQENIAEGMSPEEARHVARRTLGNIPLLQEQCRDQRGVTWAHDLVQDFRYAVRQLAKERSVTLALVLTIALGIGVNTGIFGMVNGFLRPLPVPAPEQIVVLAADSKDDPTGVLFRFSYPALQDLRKQADVFSDLLGFDSQVGGFSTGGKSTQMLYLAVTGNYFSALGVTPAIGRLFVPGEGENPGTDLTLVLGYSFWQGKLGGDPRIVGKQIRVDGRTATVIGVTSKDFHGTFSSADMQGYLPLRALIRDDVPGVSQIFTSRHVKRLTVLARLKPGVSLPQARAAMNMAASRMQQDHPETDKGMGVRVIPEPLGRPQPVRWVADLLPRVGFYLALLTSLVLLLACMNVANILLVRATVRQRETAIRAALGSGRGRLIRQMLTESVLLALLGGAAGLVLGEAAANTFAGSIDLATDLPFLLDFSFDWRVFTYAAACALFTGIVIGILPALRASRTEACAALHDGSRSNSGGPKRQRMQSFLVVGQVAGSLVLLIAASLFVRSLKNAQRMDLGFTPDHVLNARLNPQWAGYTRERTNTFYRELERRVKSWPEVESASLAFSSPMGYMDNAQPVYVEGRAFKAGEQPPVIAYNSVDTSYFETMRIPILRGRAFRESDSETAPRAAVINQTMASTFWHNQDALGKRFRTQSPDSPLWEVVGIARDSKYLLIFEEPLPYFYVPLSQDFQPARVLQIRASVRPESLATRLEKEVQTLDPNVPVSDLQTLTRSLAGLDGFLMFRIGAIQASSLGIVGLVLALIGVYGVVSYGAAQRTREIGIRIALGATPGVVRTLMMRRGAGLVVGGILLGWMGAAGLMRVLLRFLVMVPLNDPVAFFVVPGVLALVALWACYVPARRATRVDPTEALRHE